jgi:hypothetical protein
MPRLCELYFGIYLTTDEKTRKTLSQGSRRVPVGTIQNRTNIAIRIYKHNNKNTQLTKLNKSIQNMQPLYNGKKNEIKRTRKNVT